jgi:hypothetical protein
MQKLFWGKKMVRKIKSDLSQIWAYVWNWKINSIDENFFSNTKNIIDFLSKYDF